MTFARTLGSRIANQSQQKAKGTSHHAPRDGGLAGPARDQDVAGPAEEGVQGERLGGQVRKPLRKLRLRPSAMLMRHWFDTASVRRKAGLSHRSNW
jgi:hypothetical protein